MTVLVLTACSPGLRGHLTRWLLEVAPGVYVGFLSRRVRDRLWARVVEMIGDGRALMIFAVRSEQRLGFLTFGHDWRAEDFDGLMLMRRPSR